MNAPVGIATNADLVAPYAGKAREMLATAAAWARDHPDEVAVGCAPFVALTLATMRHRLNLAERALLGQCAYWGGVLAVERYRDWKDQPATFVKGML